MTEVLGSLTSLPTDLVKRKWLFLIRMAKPSTKMLLLPVSATSFPLSSEFASFAIGLCLWLLGCIRLHRCRSLSCRATFRQRAVTGLKKIIVLLQVSWP